MDLKDIEKYKEQWAQYVMSSNLIKLLSLYDPQAILKPTLSSLIRTNPKEIENYFYNNLQTGFLQKGIENVIFLKSAQNIFEHYSIDVGQYLFKGESINPIEADYTFVFNKAGFIISHHSSLTLN